MLRAMFAGFGSLMSVMDKVRGKPAAEAPADAEAPAPATTPAPEDTAATARTPPRRRPAVAETVVEPEVSAGPETVVAETVATPETTAEPDATVRAGDRAAGGQARARRPSPPRSRPSPSRAANCRSRTTTSCRSRRCAPGSGTCPTTTSRLLMTYEKAHQDRPEVIKMFQNRLIKMTHATPAGGVTLAGSSPRPGMVVLGLECTAQLIGPRPQSSAGVPGLGTAAGQRQAIAVLPPDVSRVWCHRGHGP